jgi:DNA-binding transcriptional LysR family regulator
MQRLIDRVSLDGLRVFAACARAMSFSAAARDLSVTQAAVSRRIKLLEAALGYALFTRAGRRIGLTREGAALFAAVQGMLDHLDTTLSDLARPVAGRAVSIAASASVSHLWLSARLRGFANTHPEVSVRLLTTDSLSELARRDHDLTLLYCTGAHPDWILTEVVSEALVPVAAPGYLRARGIAPGTNLSVEDLRALDLIDYARVNPHWVTLQGWAARMGAGAVPLRPRLTVSTYALAVEAALRGDGVILGSRGLLAGPLAAGELCEISAQVLVTGYGYYLGVPADRALGPEALALAHRLLSAG